MTAVLWTHTEAANATKGRAASAWKATGVSIDSRSVEPGDLFIAIRGDNTDGHRFVADALANGAAAAMVAGDWTEAPAKAPLLIVRDTDAGMADLARAARARTKARIVGVTGSVGKTSTKEMLALVFGRLGKIAATKGNLNNHWGLPLSLARMPRDAEFGIFELGMNHPGEIEPLSKILQPEVAIITTVEAVHLEHFDSEEGIADAKAEIFAGMPADGAAVLNRDNPHFDRLPRARESSRPAPHLLLRRSARRGYPARFHVRRRRRQRYCRRRGRAGRADYRLGGARESPRHELPGRSRPPPICLAPTCPHAMQALGDFRPMKGAASGIASLRRRQLRADRRKLQREPRVDARRLRSPWRRHRAVPAAAASPCWATCSKLADIAAEAHAALAGRCRAQAASICLHRGPAMENLAKALPKNIRGGHGADCAGIRDRWSGPPSAPATWSWSRDRWAAAWPDRGSPPGARSVPHAACGQREGGRTRPCSITLLVPLAEHSAF